jgi:hypothetical protein
MSDLMSMLSGLFGGGQQMAPEAMPQGQRLMGGPPPPPNPVAADPEMPGLMPGQAPAQGGGLVEGLRAALGDKLGGVASQLTKNWEDAGRHLANERASAQDPENAGLARSINRGAAAPPQGPMMGPPPALPLGSGQGFHEGGLNPDSVGGGMAAQLRQALTGGPGGPTPGGMPRPPMGGGAGGGGAPGGPGHMLPETAPAVGQWQTSAQKAPGGITGADVQSFIRSVMNGAAAVDPRAPAMKAFAQGAAGAINTGYAEEEKEKDRATKAGTTAFDQKMKTDEFGLKKNADERAGKKEGREEGVSQARINYLNARAQAALRKDGTLDNKDMNYINQHMERWAKRNENMPRDQFEKAFESEYQRQKQQYTQKKIITPGEAKGQAGAATPGGGYQDGQVAVNKQTGERLMFKGGQWVPAAQ